MLAGHVPASHAPAGVVITARHKPVAGDEAGKKCCKHCASGAPGSPGYQYRSSGIDSASATLAAVAGPVTYIGLAQSNGVALLRDPTAPPGLAWKDLSVIPGYPGHVTDITLATTVNPVGGAASLHVTVHTSTGLVEETVCGPLTAGATFTGLGGICGAFVNFTPPL